MKHGIALATTLFLLGAATTVYAQEANDLAPPPPPELEEETADAPAAPPEKKKKKLDHCGPQSAKACDGIENVADLGDDVWKIGAMGAALCSKSAAIEATRKRRKDRTEYEELLADIAEDDENSTYTPWVPSETNTAFAQRTSAECGDNKEYWCGEMQFAAAEIADPQTQAAALAMVEASCSPPAK
ncbi:MAG: hypothetical protein HOH20_09790 [Rhodospirillaceae bacterium]|jgi:hypothetical protein|nr:hypothetical protein [Rhodospirillaceae bacterium]MBT5239660.1 hypothetical protein [Rhodospirillaceae bacterium]MBT5565526.1 hypothetical protein [Rhodospirillaceae bacterium]MBT6089856.1 hypothetical protein [Rhodospirillaceae bacterium]